MSNSNFTWTFTVSFTSGTFVTTDPVQAVMDILSGASNSEWPNSTPPDRIERMEASEPSEKQRASRQSDVSLYVFSPVEGETAKFDASGSRTDQTEQVEVVIYTKGASTANNYAGAVQSRIAAFATDNQNATSWADIWPVSIEDSTAQGFYRQGMTPISVFVRLRRNAPL